MDADLGEGAQVLSVLFALPLLMGMAWIAGAFDDDDGGPRIGDPPPEPRDPLEPPEPGFEPDALLEGDDEPNTLRVPQSGSVVAQGAGGDDVISDLFFADDILPEGAAADNGPVYVDGGDGDDQIQLRYLGAQDATLIGGAGDDVVYVDERFDTLGDREVYLGEGGDALVVSVLDSEAEPGTVEVLDFDSEEDVLVFDFPDRLFILETLRDSGEITLEVTQEAIAGTNDTAVTATLLNDRAGSDDSQLSRTILVRGSGPLPDDAIRVVQGGDVLGTNGLPFIDAGSPGGEITVPSDGVVVTGTGNDVIRMDNTSSNVSQGAEVIAGAGDDTITADEGGTGRVLAGEGDDVINYRGFSSNLNGDSGDDTIRARGGFLQMRGGAGDDVIIDLEGDNSAYGETGNDTLEGDGESGLYGGSGNDVITVGPEGVQDTANYDNISFGIAQAGSGDDTLSIHMGQIGELSAQSGELEPSATDADTLRATILDEHIGARGPALFLSYGSEDSLEIIAGQSVLDGLSVETETDADGSHTRYLFRSGGALIVEVRVGAEAGITGADIALDAPWLTLTAA